MNLLLILNDGPYGTERSYNGLRLALALAKTEATEIHLFLMADAVACAKSGQTTPDGAYNIGRMLRGLGPDAQGAGRPRRAHRGLRHVP